MAVPNGHPSHILIVDDDPAIGSLLADAISGYGYRASSVCNGASMKDLLNADRVDAVVLDIRMPDEDSHSLAVYVKTLGLPVIMMSGQCSNTSISALGLPMLRKPFRVHELADMLAVTLAVDVDDRLDKTTSMTSSSRSL